MSEAKRLREIISKVATNIGNGAFCSPSCSLEFMESVAEEVRLEIADLRAKLAAETKRADDAEARAIVAESGIIGLSDRMHTAEAQRDRLAELLRECFHDGLESYRLRDRVEDALAEMEKHDAK